MQLGPGLNPPPTLSDPTTLLESRTIELVTSRLASVSNEAEAQNKGFLKWFHLVTGFATTHWGIRIGDTFYDLKSNRDRWAASASLDTTSEVERDELETMKTIQLGRTHFSDSDILKIGTIKCTKKGPTKRILMIDNHIGKHTITHYAAYNTFFDNCQTFAVNVFVKSLVCTSCRAFGEMPGPTNAFYTLFSISHWRTQVSGALILSGVITFVLPNYFDLPEPPYHSLRMIPLLSIAVSILYGRPLLNHQKDVLEHISYNYEQSGCRSCEDFARKLQDHQRLCPASRQTGIVPLPKNSIWKICLSWIIWDDPIALACISHIILRLHPLWATTIILSTHFSIAMGLSLDEESDLPRIGFTLHAWRKQSGLNSFSYLLTTSWFLYLYITKGHNHSQVWRAYALPLRYITRANPPIKFYFT